MKFNVTAFQLPSSPFRVSLCRLQAPEDEDQRLAYSLPKCPCLGCPWLGKGTQRCLIMNAELQERQEEKRCLLRKEQLRAVSPPQAKHVFSAF